MASGNDDIIMNGMMDQETESGVDFSFDLLKYVNGDEEDLLWGANNNSMRYSESETMLDPALISSMALSSPTPVTSQTTTTSNSSSSIAILKEGLIPTSAISSTDVGNEEIKEFPTINSSFFQEQHNPWGEEESVKLSTSARNVTLRTNTKLDMDRRKAQEEDRRDKELQKQQRVPLQSTAAVPVTAQPTVNVVVPSNVLQVTSRLENPTPFHVEQTRRFKIKQYCAGITSSLPDVQDTSSLGAPLRLPQHNRLQHLITDATVSSAPPNYSTTPLSPISAVEPAVPSSPGPSQRSSVATSINDEFEDSILDLILTDENTGDVASLPQQGFNRISGIPEGSSSCPTDSKDGIVEGTYKPVSKDRIKKDNHNKIERKRRFHINDMITEQSRLLPRANERHHERIGEVKQNKGSILKASVDYTKVLKRDNESLFDKLQKAEQEKKDLLLRLQRVEQLCKHSGVNLPENIVTWKTGSTPDDLTNLLSTPTEVRIKQEPEPLPYVTEDFERNLCDMMDEDRNIVTGSDPMFSQVETDEGFHHPEGMDFND